MIWKVQTVQRFDDWFKAQNQALQDDVITMLVILRDYGPELGRPYVDTLKNSLFMNMKELRIQHRGNSVRAFFAFDRGRKAIVLCAGDKTGINQKKSYKDMIRIADAEFTQHLSKLEV